MRKKKRDQRLTIISLFFIASLPWQQWAELAVTAAAGTARQTAGDGRRRLEGRCMAQIRMASPSLSSPDSSHVLAKKWKVRTHLSVLCFVSVQQTIIVVVIIIMKTWCQIVNPAVLYFFVVFSIITIIIIVFGVVVFIIIIVFFFLLLSTQFSRNLFHKPFCFLSWNNNKQGRVKI